MTVAAAIFVASFAICAYVYAGYPLLMYVVSHARERHVRKGRYYPTVSLVIPAYNEESVLATKLENALQLQYPGPSPEILVVSDGSTDGTAKVATRYVDRGVRLLMLPRRGKAHALNEGAGEARGAILVFTDANAMLARDSLMRLAENFADPEVGGVCGNKKYYVRLGSDTTEAGENLYWRFDKWQKQLESAAGSIFAADGTLYAIRRELYRPITDPGQADDIAISARVVLTGHRLVYEPSAVAWEEAPTEGRNEFSRKVRVTNHSFRALLNLGWPLWTSQLYSVELVSHKLLRHLAPFFLIALFGSNVAIAPAHQLLAAMAGLQIVFYVFALAGYALRHHPHGQYRALSVPYYFCLVNAAAFLGVLSVVSGTRLRAWNPRGGIS